jgi:alpha-mannosidase II
MHKGKWDVKSVIQETAHRLLFKDNLFGFLAEPELSPLEEKTKYAEVSKLEILHFQKDSGKSIVIFNSLSFDRTDIVTVRVSSSELHVFNDRHEVVQAQINPVFNKNFEISSEVFELHFLAKVPAFGFATYYIIESESVAFHLPSKTSVPLIITNSKDLTGDFLGIEINNRPPLSMTLENSIYQISLNGDNGLAKSIALKNGSSLQTAQCKEDLMWYSSSTSGAYLFMPNGPATTITKQEMTYVVIKGDLVQESIVSAPPVESRKLRVVRTSGMNFFSFTLIV